MSVLATVLICGGVAVAAGTVVRNYRQRSTREAYIRSFMFPVGVFEKFARARPGLDHKQQQLVARALRQFFLTFLKSNCGRVAMPSQVVDDLWHEFILFTREYKSFCDRAFGAFLHHTPAVAMGTVRGDNEGLRRVWWFTCLEENINPRKPTRLPLLFALDRKLGIADGFTYNLRCGHRPGEVRDRAAAGGQCAESFSDSSIDGGTDGFGSSGGDSWFNVSIGDSSDGGGCGGGCGGGD